MRFIYKKKYFFNSVYFLQLRYFIFWINFISYFSSSTSCWKATRK